MHVLARKLIDYGIIDSPLTRFSVGEWYDSVLLEFECRGTAIRCVFRQCFAIDFKHDQTYSKTEGSYKYWIQAVEIQETAGFYHVTISSWPFEGKIVCKDIEVAGCERVDG